MNKKESSIEKEIKLIFKKYPGSKTTLNLMRDKPNAFKILISCLLSLRTRDENTKKASDKLFKIADTPVKLVKLPIKKIENLVFSSGYYKHKARVIKEVSKKLLKDFDGEVPNDKEALLSFKGVGPKTANIVLSFAFNEKVLPIDIHCHRIPNRIGWIKTKSPEQTEIELGKILPKKYWSNFNSAFVQFGREICQPISPKCSECPIRKNCKRVGVNRSR